MRHMLSADASESLVMVVDYQDAILAGVEDADALIGNTIDLIRLARVLNIPFAVTEQNPSKLGPTVVPVRKALGAAYRPIEKMSFSAAAEEGVKEILSAGKYRDIVICGIETHVCILQTALDALHARYTVHVPAECVSSPEGKCAPALELIRQAGGVVTNVETLAYMWLKEAGSVAFRQALPILKGLRIPERSQ